MLLRLGLIGAGRWGRNYIRTIGDFDDLRLTRLASGNPESEKLAPPGCVINRDWREILNKEFIDGVIIATPPALHAAMVMAAVEAGLPVLVEKPLTLDFVEAVALRDFVYARGGFVMVGHTHLFHPAYRALKELVPRFGRVRIINSEAGNFGPFRLDAPVLWDWGAHDVALCLDLLEADPVAVEAQNLETRQVPEGLGQILDLSLFFPGDIRAFIRIGNLLPKTRRFSVELDQASLIYDDLAQQKLVIHRPLSSCDDAASQVENVPIQLLPPLHQVVQEFSRAITTCSQTVGSLDLGVRVVEVLSCAQSCLNAHRIGP